MQPPCSNKDTSASFVQEVVSVLKTQLPGGEHAPASEFHAASFIVPMLQSENKPLIRRSFATP